jgi:competence ComEA-like helix-hairpin-helix protein
MNHEKRRAEARPTKAHSRASQSLDDRPFDFLPRNAVSLRGGASRETPPSKPIDLNLANVKEPQEFPGVGPVTAQRIIDMREKSGRFHRVEDLLAIRGTSQTKLDAMRPCVTVSAPPAPASPAQKSTPPAKKATP